MKIFNVKVVSDGSIGYSFWSLVRSIHSIGSRSRLSGPAFFNNYFYAGYAHRLYDRSLPGINYWGVNQQVMNRFKV